MAARPNIRQVKRLLDQCGLPHADLTSTHIEHFFALGDDSDLFGVVGLELYGEVALLRSLAVLPDHRNAGFGKQLVARAEEYAVSRGVKNVYLITTTADQFFSRLGYSAVPRDQAPPAIRSTAEFSELCPSGSILMVKRVCAPR